MDSGFVIITHSRNPRGPCGLFITFVRVLLTQPYIVLIHNGDPH